jgi:hypothetical protein
LEHDKRPTSFPTAAKAVWNARTAPPGTLGEGRQPIEAAPDLRVADAEVFPKLAQRRGAARGLNVAPATDQIVEFVRARIAGAPHQLEDRLPIGKHLDELCAQLLAASGVLNRLLRRPSNQRAWRVI